MVSEDETLEEHPHDDWTERYRPKTLEDVVGNADAKKALREWAFKWERGKPKKKAVILAGKPGVGKTSAALALANDMGWEVLEMNASDDRNKDAIRDIVGRSAVDDTFSESGEFISYKEGKRTLLILDEADNVFGKEDRGGINEIKNTIEKTEQPIILIANDYYNLRRRSRALSKMIKKIDFKPLTQKDILISLRRICHSEDIKYEPQVLGDLSKRSDGDLRSAVKDLQSIAAGRKMLKVSHLDVLGYRNREADIFPTLGTILQGRDILDAKAATVNLNDEPRNVISWIDENLPREYKDPESLATAYDYLSKADVYLGRVVSSQYYGFWSYANDLMTAGVCVSKPKAKRGFTRYDFPSWIRKMTASKGSRSIRKRICMKLAEKLHTTTNRVNSDVLPYFIKLFKGDEEFRIKMVKDLELREEETALLLDEEVYSPKVKELYKNKEKDETTRREKAPVKKGKEEKKRKESVEKKEESERGEEKDENSGQKALFDF
ncbi:MAG: replication factor C large subunit [Thermoplasmata archaeon]